jgi:hypothetical protein
MSAMPVIGYLGNENLEMARLSTSSPYYQSDIRASCDVYAPQRTTISGMLTARHLPIYNVYALLPSS